MINANKAKLQSFYQGNLQYEIPFFQRACVWSDKKKTLKEYSSLKMTTAFLDKDDWNESTIEERAAMLANKTVEIWNW